VTLILDLDLDIMKMYLHTKVAAHTGHTDMVCSCCDLDPDSMTLLYEPELYPEDVPACHK